MTQPFVFYPEMNEAIRGLGRDPGLAIIPLRRPG